MFLIPKVCTKEFNCLHRQEAYRKAVQESRGALEEEEEDASKAENKEQVIKNDPYGDLKMIFMMVVIWITMLMFLFLATLVALHFSPVTHSWQSF